MSPSIPAAVSAVYDHPTTSTTDGRSSPERIRFVADHQPAPPLPPGQCPPELHPGGNTCPQQAALRRRRGTPHDALIARLILDYHDRVCCGFDGAT